MSDPDSNKVSFGPCRPTNKNWIQLQSEMAQWRRDNQAAAWPTPQTFCSICPTWGQFKVNEFAYRYNKAKEQTDISLGLLDGDATASKNKSLLFFSF